jgi:hypothetical protein
MKDKRLIDFLTSMRTVDDLQTNFYPGLSKLDEDSLLCDDYLDHFSPNFTSYNMNMEEKVTMVDLLMTVPDSDLSEFKSISPHELAARKAYVLLDQSGSAIRIQLNCLDTKLKKWQLLRTQADIELQRRDRVEMLNVGGHEPLDSFTSRFLFGPEPQTEADPKKDFFRVRVPTGKIAVVTQIHFDIPEVYHNWLLGILRDGVWKNGEGEYIHGYSRHYLPRSCEQSVAQVFYKNGFLPTNRVDVFYQFGKHKWNNGEYYHSYSKRFETSKLIPVD